MLITLNWGGVGVGGITPFCRKINAANCLKHSESNAEEICLCVLGVHLPPIPINAKNCLQHPDFSLGRGEGLY